MIKQTANPKVTVLMTAYNADAYIGKAIESVLNQTFSDFEFVIVDDGSTDNTYKIAKKFESKDKRISVYKLSKNAGPSIASNFGIQKSKGIYLARMDADDIAYPTRLEKQVKYLDKHPDVVIVGGQCALIDVKDKITGEKLFPTDNKSIYRALYKMNPMQHSTLMINTALVPKGHVYYHNHFMLAHDLELIFELSQFGRLVNLKSRVHYYRQYPTSLSLRDPKETFRATLKVRRKAIRRYGYKPTLTGRIYELMQKIAIGILPKDLVYPVFRLIRMKNIKDAKYALDDIGSYLTNAISLNNII